MCATPQTLNDDETLISFDDSLYQQVHGIAMGSPVSVMEDVQSRALTSFPSPPHFWTRYVDDTCCALRTDSVENFHCHLNSIEPSIQFTVEAESEGQLAFLDVLISRNPDGSMDTTVYRKPTHTNKYLDFSSHHPLAHKIAVVRTLYSIGHRLSCHQLSLGLRNNMPFPKP